MPQLGDFDSAEYAELLAAVLSDLQKANVDLRLVGIGNAESAKLFSQHTGMPLDNILVDPTATLHQKLGLHRGPDWDVPSWIPNSILEWFAKDICQNNNPDISPTVVTRAWLNYMAMCAGIAAPGTLAEIFRGYVGDKTAPERLRPEEKVEAGPIAITGVTDVKLGPIEYQSLWKDQQRYLRPAELATVRLRSMVEVLSKFDRYVPDQGLLDWRGATFLLDAEDNYKILYEYQDRGVLTYSATMNRPLSYLSEYIGESRARNPFGLKDPERKMEMD
jgi:AhpC/TSA antioxidant enzyme